MQDFCCLTILYEKVHDLYLAFFSKVVYFSMVVHRIYGKATGGFSMLHDRKAERTRNEELSPLRSEAISLHASLDELYDRFDSLTDPIQVDACIYEMNAVMARYDYTLKCLKTFELN
jgi:hypothetical protein